MILDLTLKENTYVLKIHRKFFENQSRSLQVFQDKNPLMEKYSYLGLFHISGKMFGFDGCFKKQSESGKYISYEFIFPESNNLLMMRKMILTMYLSTYYIVEEMYYEKEFFSDVIWNDQSLSFIIFGERDTTSGYSIGGQIYPWLKKRLLALNEKDLIILNKYVKSELNRVNNYFQKNDISFDQITITQKSFLIQVNMGARWVCWSDSHGSDKQDEFSSHNIDFSIDQELCFSAIIAMNTWLREH